MSTPESWVYEYVPIAHAAILCIYGWEYAGEDRRYARVFGRVWVRRRE